MSLDSLDWMGPFDSLKFEKNILVILVNLKPWPAAGHLDTAK